MNIKDFWKVLENNQDSITAIMENICDLFCAFLDMIPVLIEVAGTLLVTVLTLIPALIEVAISLIGLAIMLFCMYWVVCFFGFLLSGIVF